MDMIKIFKNTFEVIKKDIKPEYLNIFKNSYNLYKQFGDSEECLINLDKYYDFIGYNQEIKTFKRDILYNNQNDYKKGIDYKEIRAKDYGELSGENSPDNSPYRELSNFTEGELSLLQEICKKGKLHGNKIITLLTLDCYKNICMRANTVNGKLTLEYYKLIEKRIIQEIKLFCEKSSLEKNKLIENNIEDKKKIRHDAYLIAFKNKSVVYIGEIKDGLDKFGKSIDLNDRGPVHEKTYGTFYLKYVYECNNNIQAETMFKNNTLIRNHIVPEVFDGKNRIELIRYDNTLTDEQANKILKKCVKNANVIKNDKIIEKELDIKLEQERTKQKDKDIELKKLEIELRKLEMNNNRNIIPQNIQEIQEEDNDNIEENNNIIDEESEEDNDNIKENNNNIIDEE